MMRFAVLLMLIVAAFFSLTALFPAQTSWPLQPFGADTVSWLGFGLEGMPGSLIAPVLAFIAGLAFVAAALCLFGLLFPEHWFGGLVVAGAVSSLLLFGLFISELALLPIVLALFMLYGIFSKNWTVAKLKAEDEP